MNKFLKFFNLKNVFVIKLCVNIHYTCMNCRQMHAHTLYFLQTVYSISMFLDTVLVPLLCFLTICSASIHLVFSVCSPFTHCAFIIHSFCSLLCSVRANCLESNQRLLILSSVWAQLSFTLARSPFMFFNLHCHSELWSRKIILENRKTKMSMCSL